MLHLENKRRAPSAKEEWGENYLLKVFEVERKTIWERGNQYGVCNVLSPDPVCFYLPRELSIRLSSITGSVPYGIRFLMVPFMGTAI